MSAGEMVAASTRQQPTVIPSQQQTFYVGTRKSKLALVQTEIVVAALKAAWPDVHFQIHARDTAAGDIDKVTPFKDMPVKNLWTHELEQLMIEKKLDLLVHSLKDVPTQLPPSCSIGGIMARGDPRDAFVLKAGRPACGIDDLPVGAVIGTSSIRRTAQIRLRYPHLQIEDMRGNVPTRLAKLDREDGPFDALILAAAGLLRLGLGHRITQYLDSTHGGMLYAVGQGAIGVEVRANDSATRSLLSRIVDVPTTLACFAERSLLRKLEGGCSAPLGVESGWLQGPNGEESLELRALVVSVDGKDTVEVRLSEVVKNVAAAEEFGVTVATQLLHKGADRILAEIQAKKPTTAIDLQES